MTTIQDDSETLSGRDAAKRLCAAGMIVGIAALVASLAGSLALEDGLRRFALAYLVNFAFFLSLSLGALAFVMLDHVTRAGRSVVVRRLAEIMAANLAVLAVLGLPILLAVMLGRGLLFRWTDPAYMAADAALRNKAVYLNAPFFVLRMLVYFVAWIGLALGIYRRSVRQDRSRDPRLTLAMERLSVPGLVILGLTMTFAAFDLLMSLDARWSSSVFGVYYFSGAMVGFFAAVILAAAFLQARGRLPQVTAEHYHDLGKWLFAFVVFWGYIAFSQYMLIWYGNLPEETQWLARHGASASAASATPWSAVLLVLLFGHLVLPLAGLLSSRAKRRVGVVACWAAYLLAMHWLDLLWLVGPEYTGAVSLGSTLAISLGCFASLAGLYLAGCLYLAAGHSLVPLGDPRLRESLALESH